MRAAGNLNAGPEGIAVFLTGSRREKLTLNDAGRVFLVGEDGVAIEGVNDSNEVIRITGASDVTLLGLTVRGAKKHGVMVAGGARAVVARCIIENNPERGLALKDDGSELVVIESIVRDNGHQGIQVANHAGAKLTVRRTLVTQNQEGGIEILNGAYLVENTLLVQNPGGGALLKQVCPLHARCAFHFNTVADNGAHGVRCQASGTVAFSILERNGTDLVDCTSSANAVDAGCLGPLPDAGAPEAIDALAALYRLELDSDCVDQTETPYDAEAEVNAPLDDYDGEPRPHPAGGAYDYGADELWP